MGLSAAKAGVNISPLIALGGGLVCVIAGIAAAERRPLAASGLLAAAMFLAGIAMYGLNTPTLGAWVRLPPREAQLVVQIERTFSSTDPRRSSALATIKRAEALPELVGRRAYVSITLRKGQTALVRTAVVKIAGVIEALPPDSPPDTFEGYLENGGVRFKLSRGTVLEETTAPTRYALFCSRAAARLAEILGRGVQSKRPALVGVYRAMLLGQQSELSEEQREIFRQSGTMHVFSISGLHIAVIAAGVHALLSLLRLPRAAQYVIGVSLLWLYVDITGAAPSAVRAFVMVALVQSAIVLKVPRNPVSALAASCLVVVLTEPLQIFSASFQMSYGIVAALLLLGLPLADQAQHALRLFRDLPPITWGWCRKAIDYVWRGTISAGAIGVAAALVGTITGITFFKLFTPGAFVANLWLIPASTGVLLMGFVSLVCGLAGFSAGSELANHAGIVLLWAIENGVRLVVKLPAVWFAATYRTAWIGGAALLLLLGLIAVGYARHWQGWNRYYWTPLAFVAAVLLLGVQFG